MSTMDEENIFYAYCPHCERDEFRDSDEHHEHVSMCEWEQDQKREREEEE